MEWFKKHKWMSISGGAVVALILIGGLSSPTPATTQPTQPVVQTAQTATVLNDSPQEPSVSQPVTEDKQTAPALSNDNSYTNVDGNTVHSPAYTSDDSIPAGASAECGDGTYSFSQHRSGTCSHHGGVSEWLN